MKNFAKYIYILRKQLVLGFTIATYILSIYYFFFEPKLLWALVFAIFFFSFAHFFIIEIKKTDISNFIWLLLILSIILVIIIGFNNFFYVIGIGIFNIAVLFLFLDIYEEVYNRIEINSYKVFTMGVKMYSLLLSLTFAISFLGTYRSFDITCSQIYDGVKRASTYTLKYFGLKIPEIKDDKIINVVKSIKPEEIDINNIKPIGNTGDIQQFDGIQNIKFKDIFNLNFWKNVVVNQIMENKKILDKSLCSTIVQNIKEKYTNPHFQFAVLFLIFLLFYPFIRVILYVLSIFNLIAFKLMNLMHLYKFKIVVEDVEIIE